MDCSIFRKKLYDFLEDNLSYDLREAMLVHIKGCKDCSTLYKEELEIDEMFKTGLAVDTQGFRSLRNDIMRNIDKKRYNVSPIKRLFKHYKNYIATYTSLVAVIAVFVFLLPYVKTHDMLGAKKANTASKYSTASMPQDASKGFDAMKDDLSITSADSTKQLETKAQNKSRNNMDISYTPQFEKKVLAKDTKVIFNTPWETSLNKKYSATVEGKGTEAHEEGVGSIVVKDLISGKQWSFNLIDNQRQFSPKVLHFVDDENLLVTVGLGYGTVRQGGNIYLLNINTGLTAKADPQNTANLDDKSEITKIQSVKFKDTNILSIEVEVLVYEDSSLNKNHREIRTITSPFGEIVKSINQ